MNSQRFSKAATPLKTLGIVFLVFFAMAFACKDDKSGGTDIERDRQTSGGGSCSTKGEFLGIVKRDRLKTVTSRDDLKPPEFILESSDVAAPITYSPVYNNKVVKIYPAYPVTLGWMQRTYRYNRITESEYDGGLFYCYKNPEDYASKFTPEDDRFPKGACVCIAQNLEAGFTAAKERECAFDENEPDKTCSGE